MNSFIDPFLYNLPHLDLHGYDRTGARAMVKIFIDDNIRVDNKRKKLLISGISSLSAFVIRTL